MYESNHSGIETIMQGRYCSQTFKYESNHSGIETPAFADFPSPAKFSMNRTIVELRLFAKSISSSFSSHKYESNHSGIETFYFASQQNLQCFV